MRLLLRSVAAASASAGAMPAVAAESPFLHPVEPGPAGWTALIALWLIASAVLFLPSLLAIWRRHRQIPALFAFNLLFGWTGIGWGLAMVWSLRRSGPDRAPAPRSRR